MDFELGLNPVEVEATPAVNQGLLDDSDNEFLDKQMLDEGASILRRSICQAKGVPSVRYSETIGMVLPLDTEQRSFGLFRKCIVEDIDGRDISVSDVKRHQGDHHVAS